MTARETADWNFSPLQVFAFALAFIAVSRLAIGFIPVAREAMEIAQVLVSVLFVAVPILAFYKAAEHGWTRRSAGVAVVVGAVTQVGFTLVSRAAGEGVMAGALLAVGQTGLLLWAFGLGALLATIIRDKNMLLPMGLFLPIADIWLVFAPEGVVFRTLQGAPERLADVAYQVPAPSEVPAAGFAEPLVYVGPADFLFLAMFFVALHRFRMRVAQTFAWMVPVLAAYLMVVLVFGDAYIGPFRLGALPALVPIGLVIIAVNWREFRLTKDEKISTTVLITLTAIVVAWRLIVTLGGPTPEPPVEPLPLEDAQEAPAPPETREPMIRV
jgi:hypothetical protein